MFRASFEWHGGWTVRMRLPVFAACCHASNPSIHLESPRLLTTSRAARSGDTGGHPGTHPSGKAVPRKTPAFWVRGRRIDGQSPNLELKELTAEESEPAA
jgi:hypothetical protein